MEPWAISNPEKASPGQSPGGSRNALSVAGTFQIGCFFPASNSAFFLLRTEIIYGAKNKVVKETPAHHQKKFHYLFFKIQTHKIQVNEPSQGRIFLSSNYLAFVGAHNS